MTLLFWKTIRFIFRTAILTMILLAVGFGILIAIAASVGSVALFTGMIKEIDNGINPKYTRHPYTGEFIPKIPR